ncbi:fibulin-1-like [Branchiostoma lanceolatum]|uniref:fibulin-1-like n=1 Tax=Branchiostoma lanceolatum TaxID=7740 RepID=UPI00345226F1
MMRLLIVSLVVLAAVVTVSEAKKRKKIPTCDNKNLANTQRPVCTKPLVKGRFEKGTSCTWTCNHGCVWVMGPRTRYCKGRPGVWKKSVGNGYQKAKGIKCSCRSCTSLPGDWPDAAGHDCDPMSSYSYGTHCSYHCPTGYNQVGTAERLCLNGRWVDEDEGFECIDIDECTEGTHNCNADATCTNTPGSFTCACNDGFSGDGVTCTDINECADGTDNCGEGATCDNTDGSFTCSCPDGFILADDDLSCEPEPTGEMPTVMPTADTV